MKEEFHNLPGLSGWIAYDDHVEHKGKEALN